MVYTFSIFEETLTSSLHMYTFIAHYNAINWEMESKASSAMMGVNSDTHVALSVPFLNIIFTV